MESGLVITYRGAIRREARVTVIWVISAVVGGLASGLLVRPLLAVPGLAHAVERLPAPIPAILGLTAISTPDRLMDAALFGLIAPILFLAYAIGVGSRAFSAGAHEPGHGHQNGRTPASRPKVIAEAVALATGTLAIGAALWIATLVGAALGMLTVEPVRLASAIAADALLGLAFGAMALALAVMTGRTALANWTATGLAVAADAGNSLAAAVHGVLPLRYASLVYYAEGGQPLLRGVSIAHLGVLATATVAILGVAATGFARGTQGPPVVTGECATAGAGR